MIIKCQLECTPVRNLTKWVTLFAVFCLMAVGCSGGGDGGANSLTYSGLETAAVITADNAETIAAGAVSTGSSGTDLMVMAAQDDSDQAVDGSGPLFLADVAKAMESAVAKMDFQSAPQQNLTAAVGSESGSQDGSCGGSFSYSIQMDTETGYFSASLSFNSYCQEGAMLNGSASLSGYMDPNTSEMESFTLSFNYITATSGSESLTMDGTIVVDATPPVTVTMDMKVRDNSTNRVCKVENFQMSITEGAGYEEIVISGRFFDPDYGYVDLETVTTLVVNNGYENPSSGQLILHGAGNASISLTALDADYCEVEADIDGDETYDYYNGPILWTEL